jgi:AcrR family transcriptional regulator
VSVLSRKRDPGGTHELILAAARQTLAKDGEEGLSIDQVAERAGVNRSTAYQHFPTRDRLIEATVASVSDSLCEAVFGDIEKNEPSQLSMFGAIEHIAQFTMQHPELGCVWLTHVLSSGRPASDRFFRLYVSHIEAFAETEYAQPGIDVEAHAVMMLAATFLWPVWARAHRLNPDEREQMAQRFTREVLRLSLQGVQK